MPAILCIESSQTFCSVSIKVHAKTVSSASSISQNHSESISTLISEALVKSSLTFNDLDAVAVSDGPGSYTGLRIGASTAKGLCFALNIPLLSISTLKSLAHAYMKENPTYTGLIWPMIDARRMEVYHCIYDSNLQALTAIKNSILDKNYQIEYPKEQLVLCGDGASKATSLLNVTDANIKPHASFLIELAEVDLAENRIANLDTYQPFYLKPANITQRKGK